MSTLDDLDTLLARMASSFVVSPGEQSTTQFVPYVNIDASDHERLLNHLPALIAVARAAGRDAAGMPIETLLRDAAYVVNEGPLRDRLLIKADDFQVAAPALARLDDGEAT